MLRSRYRRILFFFARVLLSLAVWELILPRLGLKRWAAQTRSARLSRSAIRFRLLAVQMGGVLIKMGQFLSSRVDVLPPEITGELAGLQDEVPPEDFEVICRVAQAEFEIPLAEKFIEIESTPLAAASLGQVHIATIAVESEDPAQPAQPRQVVVKIQRPNIDIIIATDLAALRTVGKWLHRYRPISRRANVPALMEEFTRILNLEIDYVAEAHHAEEIAHNFADDPGLRVPAVYWTHTTRRVLTLEDVRGIKINDYEAISESGIDRGQVAKRLLNVYLKQIFEDGFFHADPHPGNLFVCLQDDSSQQENPAWLLTFVDFGMVGRLQPRMKAGMREMVIAVGTRSTSRLVKSYQMLGILLPGADLELIEKAEAEIFTRFWGKNMTELTQIPVEELHELAIEFRELLYTLPFQMPEDLILLGRTVGILSGMCTGLDPQFNVWESVAPFANKLIIQEAASAREPLADTLAKLVRRLVNLPSRTETLFEKVERGELTVRDPQLTGQMRLLERAAQRVAGSVVFAALLLGGVQLLLAGWSPIGELVLAASALALVWVWRVGRKMQD